MKLFIFGYLIPIAIIFVGILITNTVGATEYLFSFIITSIMYITFGGLFLAISGLHARLAPSIAFRICFALFGVLVGGFFFLVYTVYNGTLVIDGHLAYDRGRITSLGWREVIIALSSNMVVAACAALSGVSLLIAVKSARRILGIRRHRTESPP